MRNSTGVSLKMFHPSDPILYKIKYNQQKLFLQLFAKLYYKHNPNNNQKSLLIKIDKLNEISK